MASLQKFARVRSAARRACLEALEGRQLMSVTTLTGTPGDDVFVVAQPVAAADTLVLDGKGGHDKVIVNRFMAEQVLGTVQLKNPASATFDIDADAGSTLIGRSITVGNNAVLGAVPGKIDYAGSPVRNVRLTPTRGGGGHVILDTPAGSTVTIDATSGTGTHSLSLGGGGGNAAANIKGNVAFNAATPGFNSLKFSDHNDAADRKLTLRSDSLVGAVGGTVTFSGLKGIDLFLGHGADAVDIKGTAAQVIVSSPLATKKDVVRLGDNGSLAGVTGIVNAGNLSGPMDLVVDNAASTGSHTYDVQRFGNLGTVSVDGRMVAMSATARPTLRTGTGADTINVADTSAQGLAIEAGDGRDIIRAIAAQGPLDVKAGAGDDFVIFGGIGSKAKMANFKLGGSADGGTGRDTIQVLDSGEDVGASYVVTNDSIKRTDQVMPFAFANEDRVQLATTDGADTVNAMSASAARVEYLYTTNGGNDFIFGGSARERIFAGTGDDRIVPGEGFDVVDAMEGNDTVIAGDGRLDDLTGGAGTDLLRCDVSEGAINGFEGVVMTGSVRGTIFEDANGNGIRDTGEGKLAGFSQVYVELDGLTGFTAGDAGANVRPDGTYVVYDVPLVSNLKVFALLPGGVTQTAPTTGFRTISLGTGSPTAVDQDFGGRKLTAKSVAEQLFGDRRIV